MRDDLETASVRVSAIPASSAGDDMHRSVGMVFRVLPASGLNAITVASLILSPDLGPTFFGASAVMQLTNATTWGELSSFLILLVVRLVW